MNIKFRQMQKDDIEKVIPLFMEYWNGKELNFCGECRNFHCDEIMNRPRSTVLDKDWLRWKRESGGRNKNA